MEITQPTPEICERKTLQYLVIYGMRPYKKWHSFNLISSLTYNYCFQVRSVKKASSVKDFVLKPPNLNLAPLKNKNVIVSEKLISKPIKKDLKTSFDSVPVPSHLTKVPITARTWPDSNISWDYVSPTIRDLGKVFKLLHCWSLVFG